MNKINYHYNTNINNAFVAFKLGGACGECLISSKTAFKFMELIDKFKPKSNMFVIAGDYDDRFGETLTNLYRFHYGEELDKYCEENKISKENARASLSNEDKAKISAKALNAYVEQIRAEEKGRVITLTEIAECDIAEDIYNGNINGYKEAEQLLSKNVISHLCLNISASEME